MYLYRIRYVFRNKTRHVKTVENWLNISICKWKKSILYKRFMGGGEMLIIFNLFITNRIDERLIRIMIRVRSKKKTVNFPKFTREIIWRLELFNVNIYSNSLGRFSDTAFSFFYTLCDVLKLFCCISYVFGST